ncbi:LacI family DNA-binding transcriptional regulator [Allostreptomyces psammosilenae]|uniref:LacI family transcriptional regulator n=1 Tax=Allostreptomyces psammosilenae TaxID=1892865 RepID=A0A852ZP94_9ACTN|nr:LacI family DNA-binding transcriptional regulator [Allostreptomyces psammosilenae]NYI03287.1 LacI family transcriptional regulator [Allostreptomyces psammosilenae]
MVGDARGRRRSSEAGRRRPTIVDIAREAGVSPATVSRVLSGGAGVTRDKSEAVRSTAERLGYRPNLVAQGLVRGRSRSVGVLTPDVGSPFYGMLLAAIERTVVDAGYQALFASGGWEPQRQRAALEQLAQRQVDGLMLTGVMLPDEELRLLAKDQPTVLLLRHVPAFPGTCLTVDNRTAARIATEHLIELGHRRIAHVTGDRSQHDTAERLAGYRDALRRHGLPEDPALVAAGDFQEASGMAAMQSLLDGGVEFTAVFAANDQLADGVRLALHRAGLQVPGQVSLVGFDDHPRSSYVIPPLTTVRQPVEVLGASAGRHLVEMVEGGPACSEVHSPTLVVRESTAPPPAR